MTVSGASPDGQLRPYQGGAIEHNYPAAQSIRYFSATLPLSYEKANRESPVF
jgi:hypothetical protein